MQLIEPIFKYFRVAFWSIAVMTLFTVILAIFAGVFIAYCWVVVLVGAWVSPILRGLL
jgi:hypothetical protein